MKNIRTAPPSITTDNIIKAFINMDCTTSTIRKSFNVLSVTKISTSVFQIFWENPFENNLYNISAITMGTTNQSADFIVAGLHTTANPSVYGDAVSTDFVIIRIWATDPLASRDAKALMVSAF